MEADDSVTDSTISTNVSGNTVEDNYMGIYIENLVGPDNPEDISGAPLVSNVRIRNTVNNNVVRDNGSDGIGMVNLIGAFDETSESDISASVTASSIHSTFIGNEITDNDGDGVQIENYVVAGAAAYTSFTGSLLASVTNSSITNIWTSNTITHNDGDGIDNDDYEEDFGGNQIVAYVMADAVDIAGNVKADVDPSGITNILTNNVLDYNTGDGVDIHNEVFAEADIYNVCLNSTETLDGDVTAEVVSAWITNTYTGNTANFNNGSGIENDEHYIFAEVWLDDSSISGDVLASVDPSIIRNTYTGNEANNNDDHGIYHDESWIWTWVTDDEGRTEWVGGNVTAEIVSASIINTFTNNTANTNDDSGLDVGDSMIETDIWLSDGYVGGNITASVDPTVIRNTVTGNFVQGTDDDNGIEQKSQEISSHVILDPYDYEDHVSVGGNVSALVNNSTITDNYTSNTSIDNADDGANFDDTEIWSQVDLDAAEVDGNVTALTDPSGITRTFTANDFSGNENDGLYIYYNEVSALINADNHYNGYDYNETTIGGYALSAVEDAWITHTFNNNTSTDSHDDDGIDLSSNYIFADTDVRGTQDEGDTTNVVGNMSATVDNSDINNTATSNDLHGNYNDNLNLGYNYIYADARANNNAWIGVQDNPSTLEVDETVTSSLTATVLNSNVTNTVTNNNASGSDDDHGVKIEENYIYARASTDSGNVITGDVAALVDPSIIRNTITNNNLSENYEEGLHINDNYIYADADSDGECCSEDSWNDIGGSVSSTVLDAQIINTVTGNTANDNISADGMEIGYNFLYAETNVDYTDVGGSVTALVDPSGITNTFTNNEVNGNYESGVYIYENYVYAYTYSSSVDIGGALSATVNDGWIDNTFMNNTINDSNDYQGVYLDDLYIYAETDVIDESTVVGDVTALVDPSSITNTFTNNSITGNYDDNVYIYGGDIYAASSVERSDVGLEDDEFTEEVDETVISSVTATVLDATWTNTFTNNTIDGSHDGGGVEVSGQEIYAEASAGSYSNITGNVTALVDPSGTTNTFTNNSITGNDDENIYIGSNHVYADADTNQYTEIGIEGYEGTETQGNLSATVNDAWVTNTFTNNTANQSDDEDGVHLNELKIWADAYLNDTDITGNVTALVDPSSINTTLTNNLFSNNYGDNFESQTSKIYAATGVQYGSTVDGDASASVLDSTINNTLTSNTLTGSDDDDGSDFDYNYIYADLQAWGTVSGDISALVDPSGITNSFTNNDISGNDDDGANLGDNKVYANVDTDYMGGSSTGVTATVTDGTITNTFIGNTINNNDDEGVDIDNWVYARTDVYDHSVDGAVASLVDPSGITNSFTNNSISGNDNDNVSIDNNYVYAYTNVYSSSVTLEDDEETLEIDESLDADVTATVLDGFITSTFTNNTMDGSYGDDSVDFDNSGLYTRVYVNDSTVSGDVAALVDPSSISYTFTNNSLSNNDEDGVDISSSDLYAYASMSSSDIGGNVSSEVLDSTITTNFTGNTADNNGDDGIDLDDSQLYAKTYTSYGSVGGNVTALVDPSGISHTFTNNQIMNTGNADCEECDINGIDLNSNEVYAYVNPCSTEIDGNVSADVEDGFVTNTFTNNTVTNSGENGLIIDSNGVWAEADLWFDREYGYGSLEFEPVDEADIGGTVTATVTNGTVTNTLTNNNISDSGYDNVRIGGTDEDCGDPYSPCIEGNVVGSWVWTGEVAVAGNTAASVVDSWVTNTVTGNTFDNAEGNYEDLYFEDGHGLYIESNRVASYNLSGYAQIGMVDNPDTNETDETQISNQSALVDPSGIVNTITGNSASGNDDDGVMVHQNELIAEAGAGAHASCEGGCHVLVTGDVTADVIDGWITSTVTNNTLNDNGGSGFFNEQTAIYAEAVAEGDSDEYAYNTIVGGDVTSSVDPSGITTNISNNEANHNGNDGIGVEVTAMEAYTYIYNADVEGDVLADVIDGTIDVDANDNNVTENHGDGISFGEVGVVAEVLIETGGIEGSSSVGGDAAATVDPTPVNVTLNNNNLDSNDDNGIALWDNFIEAMATASSSSSVGGDLLAVIEQGDINVSMDANTALLNGEHGILTSSSLYSGTSRSGYYPLENGDSADIIDSSINDTFTGNSVSNSGYAGIEVDDYTGIMGGGTDEAAVNMFFEGNLIKENGVIVENTGIDLNYEGGGTVVGDLGGGTLLSTGGNSFVDNVGFDLVNDTGVSIMAEDNWWGVGTEDDGPVPGQIDEGAGVDADPWLISAPYLP